MMQRFSMVWKPTELLRIKKGLFRMKSRNEAATKHSEPVLNFIDVLNVYGTTATEGGDRVNFNAVVVMPGDMKLFKALLSSPICRNEDESQPMVAPGFDCFWLALRVSLKEQGQQQEKASAQPEVLQQQQLVDQLPAGGGNAGWSGGEGRKPSACGGGGEESPGVEQNNAKRAKKYPNEKTMEKVGSIGKSGNKLSWSLPLFAPGGLSLSSIRRFSSAAAGGEGGSEGGAGAGKEPETFEEANTMIVQLKETNVQLKETNAQLTGRLKDRKTKNLITSTGRQDPAIALWYVENYETPPNWHRGVPGLMGLDGFRYKYWAALYRRKEFDECRHVADEAPALKALPGPEQLNARARAFGLIVTRIWRDDSWWVRKKLNRYWIPRLDTDPYAIIIPAYMTEDERIAMHAVCKFIPVWYRDEESPHIH